MDQVTVDKIILLICERVAEAPKKHETCMGLDHKTLWDDYQDHVLNGWSLVESVLMDYIYDSIHVELEKLPSSVQKALWWQTDRGRDAMFDAGWSYEHEVPFDADLGLPAEDEILQALTNLVLGSLSSKAEAEALQEADAKERDGEDADE